MGRVCRKPTSAPPRRPVMAGGKALPPMSRAAWCGNLDCDGCCGDVTCRGAPDLRWLLARVERYVEPWWLRALRWLLRVLPGRTTDR